MDNSNDLTRIWRSAKVDDLPATQVMIGFIRRYRTGKILKKAALVITALAMLSLLVGTVFYYPSTLLTTRIGEGCMVIPAVILLSSYIRSLSRTYRLRNASNADFLRHLQEGQRGRQRYYKRTQPVCMILLSLGLLLYLFEPLHEQLSYLLAGYGLTAIWLGLNWFVLRPRAIRQHGKRFRKTLDQLETLQNPENKSTLYEENE
jgi:hypothetical protein